MDRDTLNILLNSGKYLCFNPTEIEEEIQNEVEGDTEAENKKDDSETDELFDSPILAVECNFTLKVSLSHAFEKLESVLSLEMIGELR